MVKLLFADMYFNVSLCKLPIQFKKLGAENFGLGYADRLLLKSDSFVQKYAFPKRTKNILYKDVVSTVSTACRQSNADILITNDETLIMALLRLRETLRTSDTEKNKQLLKMLEASLAPDSSHYQRHISLQLASEAGFPTPEQSFAQTFEELVHKAQAFPIPFYIKLSLAAGGSGIFLVEKNTSLNQVIESIKKSGYHLSAKRTAILQQQVKGQELTISLAAWKGQLLGYTVVKPLQTQFKNGPSSVIENKYRPHWETSLKALVRKLNLSGFGGLDVFETNSETLPTVIEVNLRLTHTTPSSRILGNDLVALLYQAMQEKMKSDFPVQHPNVKKSIAIFPDEIMRDKNSPYLKSLPLDIDWSDFHINQYLQNLINKRDSSKK